MEAFTVVIKVKYGDTLRRFNANLVDKELNLTMSELTEKIFSLFNLPADVGIMLTYTDEDGDLVALVDDDDLHDVVKQSLNPLRITVKLNTKKNGTPFTHSTRTSPSSSPRTQLPFKNSNALAAEIVKSISEPLRETLVNLSTDLAAKVSSSAPGISPGVAELVNYFSKVGLSYLNQLSESQSRFGSSTQSVVPESNVAASGVKVPDLSKADLPPSKVPLNGKYEKQSSENDEIFARLQPEAVTKDIEVKFGGGVEASSSQATRINAVGGTLSCVGEKEKTKMINECDLNEKCHLTFSNPPPGTIGATNLMKGYSPDGRTRCVSSNDPDHSTSTDTFFIPSPASGPSKPASWVVSFNRSKSQNDGDGTIFHCGVHCDGCGVHPITGPRFKSKVKVDYDLCSVCFAEMGNDSDYVRMDHPAINPHQWSFKGFHDNHVRSRCPAFQPFYRGSKTKPGAFRLDSRFIRDINILDGTIIGHLTPFTKIWRMRNNGTLVWPQRTQLVWIGGDRLSNAYSVEVAVPAAGLAMDQELDVAVDFISPELPGRYISYWRMATPSGQKFGQRVWVLIQVNDTFKETQCVGVQGLNLNLPPVDSVLTGPEIINVDSARLVEDSHPEPDNSRRTLKLGSSVVQGQQPNIEQEMKFQITDSLLIGSSAASSAPLTPPSYQYPIVDLSDMASPALSSLPSTLNPLPRSSALNPLPPPSMNLLPPPSSLYPLPPAVENTQAYTVDIPGKKEVEKKLLWELEEMGFKQVDLNKEILRMHEYNLEQAVDDLCEVAEWDPILEELLEMGFHDTERNKELLKKNNGSIKRVVMDLIAGEEM